MTEYTTELAKRRGSLTETRPCPSLCNIIPIRMLVLTVQNVLDSSVKIIQSGIHLLQTLGIQILGFLNSLFRMSCRCRLVMTYPHLFKAELTLGASKELDRGIPPGPIS